MLFRSKTLDVASLPFRINRIEGEAGFPGAGEARDDDKLIARHFHVDVLQIVDASARDDEFVLFHEQCRLELKGRRRRVTSPAKHSKIKFLPIQNIKSGGELQWRKKRIR